MASGLVLEREIRYWLERTYGCKILLTEEDDLWGKLDGQIVAVLNEPLPLPRKILWQFTRNVDNPKKQQGFLLMVHGRNDEVALYTEVDPTTLTALNRNDDFEGYYVGLDKLAKEIIRAVSKIERLSMKHGHRICQRIIEKNGEFISAFCDLGLAKAVNEEWKSAQIAHPQRGRGIINPAKCAATYGHIADQNDERWFFHFDEVRDSEAQAILKDGARRSDCRPFYVSFLPADKDSRPQHLPPLQTRGRVALAVLPA